MSRVGNIFELLSDENDEGGVRPARSVANTDVSGPKKQETKPKAAAPAKPQGKGVNQDNKAKDNRPPRTEGRNDRRQPREAGAVGEGGQVERKDNRPPRQQGIGRDGAERRNKTFQRAEGQEGEAPRKRVFDRKSGTGRGPKDTEKRGGSGKGNWGTIADEQKAQTEETGTEEKTTTEVKEGEVAQQDQPTDAKTEVQEVVEDEDAKLKTLDEYKKSIKAPSLALPPPRQVEATGAQWANLVPLARDDDEDKQLKKKKDDSKESKDDKPAISADQIINFTSESPKPYGRGRGGRKEGKPNKSKKPSGPAPNFKDEKSFPSLSGQKA